MDLTSLSPGTLARLERIKKLRNYATDERALEYCISTAWLIAEKNASKPEKITMTAQEAVDYLSKGEGKSSGSI